ncbi:hypothetical protein HYT57_05510 [Candidatus Woesearchaeota archaeon]|nr:hypothetical protein [Candidatus Woesearchaeota archaeon]
MEQIERLPAYKVWLSSINNGSYVKQTGEFTPHYIDVEGKKISRINIIATVVQKTEIEDKSYSSLTVDDGSAQIRIKTWRDDTKLLNQVNVSDILIVIGKVREYQDEIYVTPEIVKKVSSKLQILRSLELYKEYGKPKPLSIVLRKQISEEKSFNVEEEKIGDNQEQKRQRLLNKIEEMDDGSGAEISKVISSSGLLESDAEKILQSMLLEGEVFNISSSKIKLT